MKKAVLFLSIIFAVVTVQAQVTLISWTFPTGTNGDSLPDGGLSMNNGFGFRAVGTSAINYGTNGVTTYCAQATNWDNGMDSKYWCIRFYSTGYGSLTLSCAIRSGGNNPGPRDFKVQYRLLPDPDWTDAPGLTITTANNWTSGALTNAALPATLDNQAGVIELRFVMTSNTNANGGTVAANGISKIDNVNVKGTVPAGGLSGLVQYNNTGRTPIKNVTVTLYSGSSPTASTITDTLGQYSFSGIQPGTYQIRCTTTEPWGGGSSSDALRVLQYFVGMMGLSGQFLQAAEVDGNSAINSADALAIAKRFTGIITSFPQGDWLFEQHDITLTGSSANTQDILGLCRGDVNGSYIPQ